MNVRENNEGAAHLVDAKTWSDERNAWLLIWRAIVAGVDRRIVTRTMVEVARMLPPSVEHADVHSRAIVAAEAWAEQPSAESVEHVRLTCLESARVDPMARCGTAWFRDLVAGLRRAETPSEFARDRWAAAQAAKGILEAICQTTMAAAQRDTDAALPVPDFTPYEEAADRCAEILRRHIPWSLVEAALRTERQPPACALDLYEKDPWSMDPRLLHRGAPVRA